MYARLKNHFVFLLVQVPLMNLRAGITILTCCVAFSTRAQDNLFSEAFNEFSNTRLWEFEEIPIKWDMKGGLQADLNEGLNSLIENDPKHAEFSLSTVINKDSTIWQAYYYRSAARKQLKKFDGADRDLRRSLKLHHDFYEGLVEMAKVFHLRSQFAESERSITKAIRLDKTKGVAYYLKGDINLIQGQIKNAINNYKDCLAADSLFHDARIKLALLDLAAKKDVSLAISHLNKVLSYDSLQKSALLFRSILVYEKDKNQGVRDLTNLVLVSPNNSMAYYIRGVYLTELENYHQAFSDFHRVIKATSVNDNNYAGQQSWIDKKIDLQNAGAYTVTRVYGLPEDDALKIQQAFCHIITGAFDKSITIINETSNTNEEPVAIDLKEEPVAIYLKAVAYEHKGDHEKALAFYSMALTLDTEIADAHKKRGTYFQELKKWDKSIVDFTEVLRLSPEFFLAYLIVFVERPIITTTNSKKP
jgi:tetratricopeptide (TPR) repeat protein